jgi:hypothetical protein
MTRRRNMEQHKAYKRAEYKSTAPGAHQGDFVSAAAAIYDPRRDGPLQHADAAAELMGDPPIGRRAIDQRAKP